VVYWDADAKKDLLIGRADGRVVIYLNLGTDASPTFDGGTLLEVGPPGAKVPIAVGSRATLAVADWNSDGRKDLVVGAMDGKIRVYLNVGTDAAPDFEALIFAQNNGGDLVVPSGRSSPVVVDLDDDGRKDLIAGNTNGELLLYANVATDAAPAFSGYVPLESNGTPIDVAGTPRSRPSVCDWTGDGLIDVLVGAGDGLVRLYQGVPGPGDLNGDGVVNQEDVEWFAYCYTGPGDGPVASDCQPADLDADGDVDCADWDQFMLIWPEPGAFPAPPQEACAAPIPTLAEYGAVIMALLLLAAGTILTGRGA
jgi:hypothetical protein